MLAAIVSAGCVDRAMDLWINSIEMTAQAVVGSRLGYSLILCGVMCEEGTLHVSKRHVLCLQYADESQDSTCIAVVFWRRQYGSVVVSGCLFTSCAPFCLILSSRARPARDETRTKRPPKSPPNSPRAQSARQRVSAKVDLGEKHIRPPASCHIRASGFKPKATPSTRRQRHHRITKVILQLDFSSLYLLRLNN